MKKTVLLAIILIGGFMNANAQSRTNETMLEFKSKSAKISSAIGWGKNEKTGKWIENKNVIDDEKVSSYWISHISQNFKWLQFSTINQDGKDYYVFLYERLAGTYKYPSIREDWKTEKRTYFFVITSEQYNEIKTKIDLKSGENIKITSKITGHITDRFKILGGEHLYNEDNLLAKITKTIKKPSYSESCFVLNAQTRRK
ncbi:MAG: Uncharacterised protein [Polaribacter sejongensis]|nr:MAG: Uncharacterised protein [Polaribacter sejongensis]